MMASTSGLSFSFSKKKKALNLGDGALGNNNDVIKDEEDVQQIKMVDKNSLKASKKPKCESGPLVIPMIEQNTWRGGDQARNDAKLALINDAARMNGELVDDLSDVKNGPSSIPMLFQNKVPDGFETDDRLDVSLRPDGPEEADYDLVPIEAMGLAMLRGMGWKEGAPIGASNPRVVKAKIPELRPKGMGLGADRSVVQQLKKGKGGANESKDSNKPQQLILKIGACVYITSGPNRDLYAKVQSFDEDNGRAVVNLAVANKPMSVSQFALKVVTDIEYQKDSKCINKSKYDEYKVVDEHREIEDEPLVVKDSRNLKKNIQSEKPAKARSRSRSPVSKACDQIAWVRPDLKVRCIDKSYCNGKYYNTKLITVDCAGLNDCTLTTEAGIIVSQMQQRMLETVVPRAIHAHVIVIRGRFRGQLARIMFRDKDKAKADVELVVSKEVVRIAFDDICEFVGDKDVFD